jgi:hypothetical protein
VFITGVSKFSKVSLFSGLNNLEDITIIPDFSAICGYTQDDLENVFAGWIGEDMDLTKIKTWYNGYNWMGQEVYNPFDILLYLKQKEFRNFWFETGTPAFLIKLMKKNRYFIPEIQNMVASEEIVGSFDVDNITVEALLFQTGYLTITDFEQSGAFRRYHLSYPNLEVQAGLTNAILNGMVQDRLAKTRNQSHILDALSTNDFDSLKKTLQSFFSSIPHDYRKNQMARYEGYYASIVYCYFAALGLDVYVEDATNHGRIDMTVKSGSYIYIFEFKVVELIPEGAAMKQIKNKGYADKYRNKDAAIYLIGVEFSSETRNIVEFQVEEDKAIS